MGIKDRLRQARYWIGGWFCPIGDERLNRQHQELVETVRLLSQHREEDRRLLKTQELALTAVQAREAACNQRHAELERTCADLERRFETVKDTAFEILKHATNPKEPGLWLLEEEA